MTTNILFVWWATRISSIDQSDTGIEMVSGRESLNE